MARFTYTIDCVSETSVFIQFDQTPNRDLSIAIGELATYIIEQHTQLIMNATPAYNTILVDYLPNRINTEELIKVLDHILLNYQTTPNKQTTSTLRLPVYYAQEVAPDLALYRQQGLSLDEVIQLHTNQTYSVSAIGFSPGFAFLSDVDKKLELPRQPSPRLNVPKGSVAIAGRKTAVYPSSSPGGWNVIGNCPYELYNPNNQPITPFAIGMQVEFYAISKDTFMELGGVVSEGWHE